MRRLAWLACCLPLAALAAGADYARQWPLTLSRDDGGAYRVVLDAAVYRQIQSPDLQDVEVRDGAGNAVPAALFAPDLPIALPPRQLALPWFTLPAAAQTSGARDWALVAQADADGHLRRAEIRSNDRAAQATAGSALLVDLSRVREPIAALELQWQPVDALDLAYDVETSDDLEHWQPLPGRGRLVDLRRDGRRLLQRRIDLDGLQPQAGARYLRLTPGRRDQALQITGIDAVFTAASVAPKLQWLDLKGARAKREGRTTFDFDLDGRFPIRQADVVLPGNHAIQWQLESRERSDGDWRPRIAPWVAYQIGAGGERSAPRLLPIAVRDRHWRLSAAGAVAGSPLLRLGYQPEVVVFVAQGAPPYTLVAGSARAQRADSPLPQLVAAIRARHGGDWHPAAAWLGASTQLAGDAALQPARDWKRWLLWAVLALGAAIVAGFAISLLRPAPATKGNTER